MFGKDKKCAERARLSKYALIHSAGVLLYTIAVSQIMIRGGRWFGSLEFLAPVAVLMLLVLSVAVVGTLIFGKPILLYLDGKKKEGVTLLSLTLLDMFLLTALVLLIGVIA